MLHSSAISKNMITIMSMLVHASAFDFHQIRIHHGHLSLLKMAARWVDTMVRKLLRLKVPSQ